MEHLGDYGMHLLTGVRDPSSHLRSSDNHGAFEMIAMTELSPGALSSALPVVWL